MNECAVDPAFDPASCKQAVNRWIVAAAAKTAAEVTDALDGYRFNEAAGAVYQFTWGTFCDWYLEFTKPVLTGEDAAAQAETRATAAWTLGTILKLLQPFMPFVTEEIWERTRGADGGLLILAAWPETGSARDDDATDEMEWVIRLISNVRTVRSEMNVPPGARIAMRLVGAGDITRSRLEKHRRLIATLARFDTIDVADTAPSGSVQIVVDEATVALPLAEVIDIAQERGRLERELDKVAGEISKIDSKLANKKFVEKAPEHVVEEQRERRVDAEATQAKLTQALERLKAVG